MQIPVSNGHGSGFTVEVDTTTKVQDIADIVQELSHVTTNKLLVLHFASHANSMDDCSDEFQIEDCSFIQVLPKLIDYTEVSLKESLVRVPQTSPVVAASPTLTVT